MTFISKFVKTKKKLNVRRKSKDAKKLMSSASISGFSSGRSNYEPSLGSGGSCATGNCPFA